MTVALGDAIHILFFQFVLQYLNFFIEIGTTG